MDFSSNDINLLYGERFFLIEADEAKGGSVPPQEKAPIAAETKAEAVKPSPQTEEASPNPKEVVESTPAVESPKPVAAEPAAVVPSPPPVHLLTTGEKAVWKMRPTAQFVVVLRKQEFANRDLTGLLKNQLLQAQIDPTMVGFGIISDEAKSIDLSSSEKPFVLLFDQMDAQWPAHLQAGDKTVWPLPNLQQCQTDPSATRQVLEAMATLKKSLN
ncbi:MAG: hypothetical protein AAFN10_25310 [Bacteroidota bacterium]